MAASDATSGPCVLFLPQNMRRAFFVGLLTEARKSERWNVAVACNRDSETVYRDLASPGGVYTTPDFGESQPWENDARTRQEVDALISRCERETGLSAHRILVAGDRDIGRAFGRGMYHYPVGEVARRSLADNTVPEAVLRRMFHFARATLTAARPDFLVSGYVSPPHHTAFLLVAGTMGIPFATNRLSKVLSGMAFWSTDARMGNGQAAARFAAKRGARSVVSAAARDRLTRFRSTPQTVDYIRKNWKNAEAKTFMRQHTKFLHGFVRWGARLVRGGPRPASVTGAVGSYYRSLWLRARQEHMYKTFSDEQLRGMKYVYFPMHKEPELAINYMAPFWINQLNTVRHLSAHLPYGSALLVRDHRLNIGRRPMGWMRDLAALPNVTLIDPTDEQFKYLRNATVVATENGSSGWEGVMLGRSVLTLARTFYDAPGLTERLENVEELDARLLRLFDGAVPAVPQRDDLIGWFLDSELETSHVVDPPDYERSLALLREVLATAEPARRAFGAAQ